MIDAEERKSDLARIEEPERNYGELQEQHQKVCAELKRIREAMYKVLDPWATQ